MLAKRPAHRPGTADEVVNVAELLLSTRIAFSTGADLLIDGGATASWYYGLFRPQSRKRKREKIMNEVMQVTLSNGVTMPQLGYGVYQVTREECERCVTDALAVGYRHIDTAQSYFNETEVGAAIRKSGIPRKDIFLTTKVSTGGVIGLSAGKGAILKVTLVEANLVPFVMNALKNMPVALELASRLNLPGADDIFLKQFSTLMQRAT